MVECIPIRGRIQKEIEYVIAKAKRYKRDNIEIGYLSSGRKQFCGYGYNYGLTETATAWIPFSNTCPDKYQNESKIYLNKAEI